MMADEGAGSALQMTIQMTHEAVTITSAVTRLSASALGQIMRVAGAGLGRVKTKHLETGKVTIARLQRQTGGDLHALPITPELERSVKADLRRRGTNFSIEHGADGDTYVHFSGRDVDEVQHGLQQAAARFSQRHGRNAGEERSRAPRAEADEPEAKPPAPEPEAKPPAPEPEASEIDAWLTADPIAKGDPDALARREVAQAQKMAQTQKTPAPQRRRAAAPRQRRRAAAPRQRRRAAAPRRSKGDVLAGMNQRQRQIAGGQRTQPRTTRRTRSQGAR